MISQNTRKGQKANLGPQPWLSASQTQKVIHALTADGGEVRFVGGCVRDTLINRPFKDIDIATPTEPDAIIKLLERSSIKAIPTGISHGTITAVCKQKFFQITTLRRDEKTDGRHAKVVFTDDWAADARRRDFTINALSADPTGEVYDYDEGISDLTHGRVRFIGNAQNRIDEDYLRILRFFRFQGGYGLPPLDDDAIAASRSRANKLSELSGERVRDEFLKILMVPDPAEILTHMQDVGVLDVILPEATGIYRIRLLNELETGEVNIRGIAPDALRRLAALLDPEKDEASLLSVATRLKLSNADRSRLTNLMTPGVELFLDMSEGQQMQLLRKLGADQTRNLVLLTWASALASPTPLPASQTEFYTTFLKLCANWQSPEFPLTGADVIALGILEGPEIGAVLERMEAWWENSGYTADRQQCLDRLYWDAEKTKEQI